MPHWPASAVVGHAGQLVVGTLGGQARRGAGRPRALLRRARPRGPSTFATRVAGARSACRTLILTNAAGGINITLHAGRADGDRRSHQPDGQQSAGRAERRALRPALSGHDRGLLAAAARRSPTRRRAAHGRAAGARRLRRAARPELRDAGRDPRSCGRSAPTRSACRPCPRRSSRGTWGSRCSASRASPTWPPACCRSRSITTR